MLLEHLPRPLFLASRVAVRSNGGRSMTVFGGLFGIFDYRACRFEPELEVLEV